VGLNLGNVAHGETYATCPNGPGDAVRVHAGGFGECRAPDRRLQELVEVGFQLVGQRED
jgi:hypothetical protein